jgi:WD40 repeat protein
MRQNQQCLAWGSGNSYLVLLVAANSTVWLWPVFTRALSLHLFPRLAVWGQAPPTVLHCVQEKLIKTWTSGEKGKEEQVPTGHQMAFSFVTSEEARVGEGRGDLTQGHVSGKLKLSQWLCELPQAFHGCTALPSPQCQVQPQVPLKLSLGPNKAGAS